MQFPAKPGAPAISPAKPFDYTAHVDRLIENITALCPAFTHIDTRRVLTGWSQSRVGGEHGVYATIQGLRFAGGAETLKRGSSLYRWQRVTHEGEEILYVIYFMLPRYANLPFRSKLTTVFHELFHVSPRCDGDLRRFAGRNYAHGHSREVYNARLQPWIDDYLKRPDSAQFTGFLHLTFSEIEERYSGVVGRRLQPLKPVLVK